MSQVVTILLSMSLTLSLFGCGDYEDVESIAPSQVQLAVAKYKVLVHTGHVETSDLMTAGKWQTVRAKNDGFWVGANTFASDEAPSSSRLPLSTDDRKAIVSLSSNKTATAGFTYQQAVADNAKNFDVAVEAGLSVPTIMVYNKIADKDRNKPAMDKNHCTIDTSKAAPIMTKCQIDAMAAQYKQRNVIINIRSFSDTIRDAVANADGFSFEWDVTGDDYDKLEQVAQAIEYGFAADKKIFLLNPPGVEHHANDRSYLEDYKTMVRWLRDRVGVKHLCSPRVRFIPANYSQAKKDIHLAPETDGGLNANTQLGAARWLILNTSICG